MRTISLDELNLYLPLTDLVTMATENMRPYHNVLGFSGPNDFSNNIKFPKTHISTLAAWMNDENYS
ncbi:MAG: hypothetical protein PHN51_10405 [Candidatus Nanopelagicales bacterium]|nr:hypothetical protein [Candidatus Nanopelagicales bacterium]